jgi:hypothetical protein
MMIILIQYSKEHGIDLYVGFMDYEKAYDYANRANIVADLMKDGCSGAMVRSIAKMMKTSTYYPKCGKQRLSNGIETDYGVTQGRCSSGNIFSYYVSRMSSAFDPTKTDDFMDPYNLAQLADDTAFYATTILNLEYKFRSILSYSADRYQVPNISKTKYCNFSENPSSDPIIIDENVTIQSVDDKGYKYIGMMFYPTNDMDFIIQKNIDNRIGNIAKFYGWLEVNENTPIEVKLMVFDNCVFSAILYGSEAWGDIKCIEKQLAKMELKALKAILKVKSGTTNDIVFHELRRCSFLANVKDRQYEFYNKIIEMAAGKAIVQLIIEICKDTKFLKYYRNLKKDNGAQEIAEREIRIKNSTSSMCKYYVDLQCANEKSCIYNNFCNDHYRYIITRWRLSNHKLKIETDRYHTLNDRESRSCDNCNTLEDEYHVIFKCPLYATVRSAYPDLIQCDDIKTFLNPVYDNIIDTAAFIHAIEELRSDYP